MIIICNDISCANNNRKVCKLEKITIVHGAQGIEWSTRECGNYIKREKL